jgi:hypothetical protein
MPIRKVSLQDYVDEVSKINDFSKSYESFLFPMNKYVVYGDESCQKSSKKLFEEVKAKHGTEWVLFSLAFLTKFNVDQAMNKIKLIELSRKLNIKLIENDNRKYYMNEIMFKKFYKIYFSMISENCINPVFNSHFGEEADIEHKEQLHAYFREELIDLIIAYHIETNGLESNAIINLDDFLKNVEFLNNDEEIRRLLEEAHIDRAKFLSIKSNKASTTRDRRTSVTFEDEACDDVEQFASMI